MTPMFTHFFPQFFLLTEKAVLQTFSLLGCMDETEFYLENISFWQILVMGEWVNTFRFPKIIFSAVLLPLTARRRICKLSWIRFQVKQCHRGIFCSLTKVLSELKRVHHPKKKHQVALQSRFNATYWGLTQNVVIYCMFRYVRKLAKKLTNSKYSYLHF